MFGNGVGFTPDSIAPDTQLVILAQNPGADEERGQRVTHYEGKHAIYEPCTPQPLIGKTGYELRQHYLPLTGVMEAATSFCNVLKCRAEVKGRKTNTLPNGEALQQAIAHCTKAHLTIPDSTQLIIAMGGPAFEFTQPALVQASKKGKRVAYKDGKPTTGGLITTWRGFIGPETLNNVPVFAVIHLAELFRDTTQRLPARLDWKRVARVLQGTWPQAIPSRLIATGDVEALSAAFDEAEQSQFVVCDTEYNPQTRFLSMVGLGWRDRGRRVNGVQIEWVGNPQVTSDVRSTFIRRFARLVRMVRVVFQNAKADLPVIDKNLHISPDRYFKIDDTMHMHSVLWSELPHKLEFLASIYGQYPKLKHLQHSDELLYNFGDVIETLTVYEALLSEFKADPLTYDVYVSQSLPLIPITLKRETHGIKVNQTRLSELIKAYQTASDTFDRMAEAYAGYEINLMSGGETGQLAAHLRTFDGIDLDSVDEETIAAERDAYLPFDRQQEEREGFPVDYIQARIDQGAHPLLELRAAGVYYKTTLNQDLLPLVGKERVYPSFHFDAQESGRWSTTHPALAKVPNDLLDLYIPDEGYLLFGADYDAQEPRIFMAESKSAYLTKAFDEGLDIHTMLVCDMFGWPYPPNLKNPHTSPECAEWRTIHDWGGKEDKRRTVAKNVRYERYYMGMGLQAIKKAVKLGIPKEAMQKASRLVIDQDPNVAEFHRKVKKLAKTKRCRTWGNRLRVFLGQGEKIEKEMCNQFMQGGGVDLLNKTVIEVRQTYPFVTLFYTRHDSFFFEVHKSMFTPQVAEGIRRIAEQPRLINGMSVAFPCSWKTMDDKGQLQSYTFTKEVAA